MTALKPTVLLVALAVSIAAVGCGGDDEGSPIPAATARALNAELDGVQARLDNGSAGACRDILQGSRGPNLERVNALIGAMPDDVDPDVRSALEESFDRLWDLVQQDCDEKAQQEEEEAQPEPETETQTTPPETETEETTPTETQTETTPTEEEQLPPEGDGDNDGGVPGNGNGNGVEGGGGVGPGGADLGGG